MNVLAAVCFIGSGGWAVAMHYFDKQMQRYRSPTAPPGSFRWVPVRWWDPKLYEGPGRRYRSLAIRSWWMTVAFFLIGVVAMSLAA